MRIVFGLFLAATVVAGALVLAGCNGGTSSNQPFAITIALTPSGSTTIRTGQSLAINAALTHDEASKGVTWSLNGVGTLSDHTSTSVTYTAPATIDSNTPVTVTATSVAQSMANAQLSIMVKPPLAVLTTSLPDGTVGLPYSATLQATGSGFPYVWSIASGSLPSWATLSPLGGVISGMPDAAGTVTFAVQIQYSATPAESATQALTLTVAPASSANNAMLNGQYAFRFQGFDDATGSQWAMVGSFVADGQGGITSGLEDFNGPGGYQAAIALTGTYAIGTDRRGTMRLINSSGSTVTFTVSVGTFNDTNVATRGSLIEFDDMTGTTGKRGSGFLYLQNPNTFHLPHVVGAYAFLLAGQTQQTGTRLAAVGAYTADGNGNLTNGQVDSNIDGVMESQMYTASIAETPQTAAFGRMALTPGNTADLHLVYYIVTDGRTLAMSTDPESTTGLLAGEVMRQDSAPYSSASLNGTAVGYGVGKLSVSAGLWTFDGTADASYSLVRSDAQYIYLGPQTGSLTYAVAANGRVTTTGVSVAAGVPGQPILYLVDSNKGFLMSTDASVSTGFLEEQADAPFSNGTITGTYAIGTEPPAVTSSTVVSGVGTSKGDGVLNMTLDVSHPTDLLNADVSETWRVNIDSTGFWSDPELSAEGAVYLVSRKKAVVLKNAHGWPMIAIFQQ